MPEVHQAPPGSKGADPPTVDLADPAAARAWILHLRAHVDDLAAAAEDATRPPGRRMLGRAAARGIILETRRSLHESLDAVTVGHNGRHPPP